MRGLQLAHRRGPCELARDAMQCSPIVRFGRQPKALALVLITALIYSRTFKVTIITLGPQELHRTLAAAVASDPDVARKTTDLPETR